MKEENRRECKPLIHLVTGYAGVLCSFPFFHKFKLISKVGLKVCLFQNSTWFHPPHSRGADENPGLAEFLVPDQQPNFQVL